MGQGLSQGEGWRSWLEKEAGEREAAASGASETELRSSMIAAKHRVSRRLSPALRLKLVRRAELRELEGEAGKREAAASGASVTEVRSSMVAANHRVPRRLSPALRLKSVLRAELRELEGEAGERAVAHHGH